MPLQATAGAATYDAFGGGVTAANYIEDVFQTWLYTGNGSTQTITNGVDLAGKGGMVWLKGRDVVSDNTLADTTRGTGSYIYSNSTSAADTGVTSFITAFNTTGFSLGSGSGVNQSSKTWTSWTFRKQPKFFDVVTYTGDGTTTQVVNHNLGSAPGMIIAKRTDGVGGWAVWHRGNGTTSYGLFALNDTSAATANFNPASNPLPSATQFYPYLVWDTGNPANAPIGATYVAYLFAHDAGGFGASGTDNVISCGSFTTDGSGNATVTLGYEPQWVMWKASSAVGNWVMIDNMRGWSVNNSDDARLRANLSNAENMDSLGNPTATGFYVNGGDPSATHIYIAIRRGPMRTPTSGTSVYSAIARTGTSTNTTITGVGFSPDLSITKSRSDSGTEPWWSNRLCGPKNRLLSNATVAEASYSDGIIDYLMDGASIGIQGNINESPRTYINYFFRRAPGFFDEVCYTGTGSATTFSHNLGVAPEMMIVKRRSAADDWWVYDAATGNTKYQVLNSTATPTTSSTAWNNTTPTSSVFTVGTGTPVNASAGTYVAYLFATVAGVSKVFSYTGNGSSQTINCGFTAGARFVLIKRTDSTGDWYVWDSARGIVAGNDPHLSLNSAAAEVTTDDSVDTDNTGFVVNQVAATNVNVSSATYIGLAVA